MSYVHSVRSALRFLVIASRAASSDAHSVSGDFDGTAEALLLIHFKLGSLSR